jgi:adenylosuccinate synthase
LTRYFSITGLGFGDCGKGLFTDALCRLTAAHTVVRFNGGAQAGHNVVTADGRHHTFSQFGAGSLSPDVVTILAEPVAVHPTALLAEARHLSMLGMDRPLERIMIDAQCKITTPFHQSVNRIAESQRTIKHGTCGVGFGQTARVALDYPDLILRYGDLFEENRALEKLEAIRRTLNQEVRNEQEPNPLMKGEFDLLQDPGASQAWMGMIEQLLSVGKPATKDQVRARLELEGTVVFEGAQGILLDQDFGFHPYTTWSDTRPSAAQSVLSELGITTRIRKLGVARSYLTRHGPGPFPTEDERLDGLAEPHNSAAGWQGRFRRGHPDGVLLRYAIDASRDLDGLLISHLDYFGDGRALSWCTGYRLARPLPTGGLVHHALDDDARVVSFIADASGGLARQIKLMKIATAAVPVYEHQAITSPSALLERFEWTSGLPVLATGSGPSAAFVKSQKSLLSH